MPICFQFQKKHIDRLAKMTFSMSELNRTTKLLIETDEEDPDAAPQKSAKEIEEEKKAEKDAQQKMVSLFSYFFFPFFHIMSHSQQKIIGGTPEVRSDKSLTLLTFDI